MTHLHCLVILMILCSRMFDRRAWSKPRKVSRGISVASRKANKQGEYCDESMLSHIMWWKEVVANSWYLYPMHQGCFFCYLLILYYLMFQKMERCRKPSSIQLTQRLVYSNILGLDPNLRNGRCGICFMRGWHNYALFSFYLERFTWCYHWHNTALFVQLERWNPEHGDFGI